MENIISKILTKQLRHDETFRAIVKSTSWKIRLEIKLIFVMFNQLHRFKTIPYHLVFCLIQTFQADNPLLHPKLVSIYMIVHTLSSSCSTDPIPKNTFS